MFCAEEEGFEPPDPCGSTVFKTAAIDHSAIPPIFFKSLLFPFSVFIATMLCKSALSSSLRLRNPPSQPVFCNPAISTLPPKSRFCNPALQPHFPIGLQI
jgi:hypothetical protein